MHTNKFRKENDLISGDASEAVGQLLQTDRQIIPQRTLVRHMPIDSVPSASSWLFEVNEPEAARSSKAANAQTELPTKIKAMVTEIIRQLDSYLELCKVSRNKTSDDAQQFLSENETPSRDIIPPKFDLLGLNKRLYSPIATKSKVNLARAAISLLEKEYQKLAQTFENTTLAESQSSSSIFESNNQLIKSQLPTHHINLLTKFAEVYLALDAKIEGKKSESARVGAAFWQSVSTDGSHEEEATSEGKFKEKIINLIADKNFAFSPSFPLKLSENANQMYEALQKINPFAELAFDIIHTLCKESGYKGGKAGKWYKQVSPAERCLDDYFATAINLLQQTRYHNANAFQTILSNLLLLNRWLEIPINQRPEVAQFPEIPCPNSTYTKSGESERDKFLRRNENSEYVQYGINAPLATRPQSQHWFWGHIPKHQVVIESMLKKVKDYEPPSQQFHSASMANTK